MDPRYHYVNISVSPDEHITIKELARAADLTVSQFLRKIIRKHLGEKLNKAAKPRLESELSKIELQ